MKNRKRYAAVAVLLGMLVVMFSFGTTYAVLIASDKATNEFTIGETIIEIKEDFTPPPKLEPGTEFVKKPWVVNTGNLPGYVRMRADFSDSRARDFCEDLEISADWYYNTIDGYYYYKNLLEPGKSTSALFEKVEVKTESAGQPLTDADMVEFDILIYAECVQHIDHSGDHAANEYLTAWQNQW